MSIRYSDELRRGRFGHIPGMGGGGQNAGGGGPGGETSILVDDFSTWKVANTNTAGDPKFWRAYNGNLCDAGPNQTDVGISGNQLLIDTAIGDVYYVNCASAPYTDPGDWMHSHSTDTWPVNGTINRMVFGIVSNTSQSDGGTGNNMNVGTYEKELDDFEHNVQGRHFYHSMRLPMTANVPFKVWLTNRPDHEVTSGAVNWAPRSAYFDKMTRMYLTPYGPFFDFGGACPVTPSTCPAARYKLFPIWAYQQTGEDDEYLGLATMQYDGSKYVFRVAGRSGVHDIYDVRYRTDGVSMHDAGFTSGTSDGTVEIDNDAYLIISWNKVMSESTSGIHLALRRQGQTTLFSEYYLPYQFGPNNMGVP